MDRSGKACPLILSCYFCCAACGEHVLSSFAWHPKDENRLLAAAGPSHVKDIIVFERIPMVSKQLKLSKQEFV